MFYVRIAGIPIRVDNRYPYIRQLCEEYVTQDQEAAFAVGATEEEILKERKEGELFSEGYYESLCIYRKICGGLARYQGFLLHSAAVSVDNRAYVFAAPSGTGKTTHLRLWLEEFCGRAEVINGDKPIFRFVEDILYVCGTPWCGKEQMGKNTIRRVQAICFLEQGRENHIRRFKPHEISQRLFRQVFIPRERKEFEQFWPLMEKLVSRERFYLLQCNREPEAAQLAYRVMREENQDAEN